MKKKLLPDADYLRSLFAYDPETGILTRKIAKQGTRVGDIVGSRDPNRYIRVGIDFESYLAHLIIWKMVTGEDPINFIDHENTLKIDNRWVNLRPATMSQNQANRGRTRSNTSGHKGVYRFRNGWVAQITKDGKPYNLGVFPTKELAHAAYAAKALELFGEYARNQ